MKRPHEEWKIYWRNYEGEKCSWHIFYGRMVSNKYPITVAIQELLPSRHSLVSHRAKELKYISHSKANEMRYNPSYYEIDIKYPKEEFEIIKRGYERQLDYLDNTPAYTPNEEVEKQNRITKLQDEFKKFLLINTTITC